MHGLSLGWQTELIFPRFDAEVVRRDDYLVALIDLQVAADAGRHEPVAYRVFRERQMTRDAAMQRVGLGHWFAARDDGRILETLVIAADPDDVAIGIYEAVGFERLDDTLRLHCRDRDAAGAP